jgi:hypothetical protein
VGVELGAAAELPGAVLAGVLLSVGVAGCEAVEPGRVGVATGFLSVGVDGRTAVWPPVGTGPVGLSPEVVGRADPGVPGVPGTVAVEPVGVDFGAGCAGA